MSQQTGSSIHYQYKYLPADPFRYDLLTIVVLFLILATVFIIYFPLAAAIILGLTIAIVVTRSTRNSRQGCLLPDLPD
jgi:hypothetical protein